MVYSQGAGGQKADATCYAPVNPFRPSLALGFQKWFGDGRDRTIDEILAAPTPYLPLTPGPQGPSYPGLFQSYGNGGAYVPSLYHRSGLQQTEGPPSEPFQYGGSPHASGQWGRGRMGWGRSRNGGEKRNVGRGRSRKRSRGPSSASELGGSRSRSRSRVQFPIPTIPLIVPPRVSPPAPPPASSRSRSPVSRPPVVMPPFSMAPIPTTLSPKRHPAGRARSESRSSSRVARRNMSLRRVTPQNPAEAPIMTPAGVSPVLAPSLVDPPSPLRDSGPQSPMSVTAPLADPEATSWNANRSHSRGPSQPSRRHSPAPSIQTLPLMIPPPREPAPGAPPRATVSNEHWQQKQDTEVMLLPASCPLVLVAPADYSRLAADPGFPSLESRKEVVSAAPSGLAHPRPFREPRVSPLHKSPPWYRRRPFGRRSSVSSWLVVDLERKDDPPVAPATPQSPAGRHERLDCEKHTPPFISSFPSKAFLQGMGPSYEGHTPFPKAGAPTLQVTWYAIAATLFLEIVPQQVYLHFLLRFPSLYFSRVTRIFQDANLGMGEIKRMALEAVDLEQEEGLNRMLLNHGVFPQEWHSGEGKASASYMNLRYSWQAFIDSLMREWKTLNIISVLLLSAILTILQIESAAENPLTRFSALLSLVCAFMSLIYGCLYIVRFGTMRKTHKAAEWANESEKTSTSIFWNVWVMLAMPAVWLGWSMIFYIICVMSFVWQTGTTVLERREYLSTDLDILVPRIVISCVLGLGIFYLLLMGITFRRYGDAMEQAWQVRIRGWLAEKAHVVEGYYHDQGRKGSYAFKEEKPPLPGTWVTGTPSNVKETGNWDPLPVPPPPTISLAEQVPSHEDAALSKRRSLQSNMEKAWVTPGGVGSSPLSVNPFTSFERAPPVYLDQPIENVQPLRPGSRSPPLPFSPPKIHTSSTNSPNHESASEGEKVFDAQYGLASATPRREIVMNEEPSYLDAPVGKLDDDPKPLNHTPTMVVVPLAGADEDLQLEEMQEIFKLECAGSRRVQPTPDGGERVTDSEELEHGPAATLESIPIPRQLSEQGMARSTWARFCEDINTAWVGVRSNKRRGLEAMVETVDVWNGHLDPFDVFLALIQVEGVKRQDNQSPSNTSQRYSLYLGSKGAAW